MSDTRFIPNPNIQVTRAEVLTPLRLKEPGKRRLFTKGRLPWLVAGLALAVGLFATDGGGEVLYARLHTGVSQTKGYLVSRPGAPLAFLSGDSSPNSKFRLQGIIYSQVKPMAVINSQPCTSGEVIAVPVGRKDETVTCLDIQPASVRISTRQGSELSLVLASGRE
jgi:hypothetical protein